MNKGGQIIQPPSPIFKTDTDVSGLTAVFLRPRPDWCDTIVEMTRNPDDSSSHCFGSKTLSHQKGDRRPSQKLGNWNRMLLKWSMNN